MHDRRLEKGMAPNRVLKALGLAILIAGCSTPLSTREKGALAGGAVGAGAGAVIGSTTEHTGTGALIGAGVGAVSGALIGDAMQANEQRQAAPARLPAAPPATAPPPPAPVVVAPPPPETLYAKEIWAGRVRANTIYANEIKATEVRGQIYQTGKLETQGWHKKIKAAVVSVPVIYAKEIKAKSVAAEAIYVHRLRLN
jgi:hypothetical protein